MPKPAVYLETTVISYLTAWPSRDIVRRSHEIITQNWWTGRDRFELYVSELLVREISAGDPIAAADRLRAIDGIPLLPLTEAAIELAERLADGLVLPARARADAVHIAIAATHGTLFLLTWNCRHLANAALTAKIEQTCASVGFVAPRIVTPEMLMESP